jgi:hypothetical protein
MMDRRALTREWNDRKRNNGQVNQIKINDAKYLPSLKTQEMLQGSRKIPRDVPGRREQLGQPKLSVRLQQQ